MKATQPLKRTILITGATDGIGMALSNLYREQCETLVLVGRRSLDELQSPLFTEANYCRADLGQPDCSERVVRFLESRGIRHLDLLIQNAGLGYYGTPASQSSESIQQLLAVNFMAPVSLTHALLPYLSGGKVVFVSSVVSALACPDYAVYGAAKAALDGFARSLRIELQGSVKVQTVFPGATRTGMHAKSGLSRDVVDWEKFPSAETVAKKIVRGIERGGDVRTIGAVNRLLRMGGRFSGPFDWLQSRGRR